MWPFCFVLNKILKAEEDEEEIVNLSDGNIVSKVERCSSEHVSSNEKYSDALLPRAHFVEVSAS